MYRGAVRRPTIGDIRLTMPDGLDTLRAVAPDLQGFDWTPQRIAAEGDLVMTHSRVVGWAERPVIIVDIFRLADGRIVRALGRGAATGLCR